MFRNTSAKGNPRPESRGLGCVAHYRGDTYRLAISTDPNGITYRRAC